MMQYLFQNFNFRGKAKPYQEIIKSDAAEEIGHVELISTTIEMLPQASTDSHPPNKLPLEVALQARNIHHFLVGGTGGMPVNSAGNPWSGSYVHNSGNLVLDLSYNLMLECTGRLDKCRLYAMSDSKSFRATVSYLIVRDLACTFSNESSGLPDIVTGASPFNDGELEALEGLREGFDVPQMPEAPQECSPGFDKELKQKAMLNLRIRISN